MILRKIEDNPVIIFFAIIVFHYWSLMRYPPPFVDEAWMASRAWSFLQNGLVFGPLDAGVFDRIEGYWTFFPRIYTWIESFSLRLFGFPSLLSVRVVSLIFGVLLLIAVYMISKSIGSNKLAIGSVTIVAFSRTFIISSHLARPDIIAAALGYSAIALLIYDKFSRWWVGLIAGLLLGISFEIHPHSAIFIPAIFFLYIYEFRFRFYRSKNFWGLAGGLSIGALIYIVFHVLPYPRNFLYFNQIAFSLTHTPPILTGDISIILGSFKDTGLLIGFLYLVSTILIIISGYLAIKKKKYGEIKILVVALGLFFFTSVLIRNKNIYYGILITPAIDILLASLLLLAIKKFRATARTDRLLGLITIGIIIGTSIGNVTLLYPNHRNADLRVTERINEVIEESDIIMGSQVYWFGLSENRYYSWETLIYFNRYFPGSNLVDAFSELNPDIFIIDDNLRVSDYDGDSPYDQHLRLPASELIDFLEDNATLLADFDGGVYGGIKVFRINW